MKDKLLETARSLPADQLPRFLGDLEEVRATALARLTAPAPATVPPDELLDVEQASKRLGVSVKMLYSTDFPFVRKVGTRRLFSARGIERYIAHNGAR